MGSTPSSQLQAENGNVVYQSTQGRPGNIKESLKLLNKKPKMALEESNPEQMGEQQQDEEEAPVKKTSTKRDERNKHDDRIDAPIMGAPLDFETLARSNIPKSAFDDQHSEEEEENQQDYNRNRKPEPRRLNARTKPIPDNVKHEQQVTHERTKMRHPPKHPQEADYLHNSSILTKPHKPHHPAHEEIDIHQFNSAHIRHKAIQEVHMQEHPLRPIKQQEPAYQHQQLYPKILKNYHKETPTHQKHQEDPHEQKINVFKRHRPGFHQETQQEEEAVPISHPNFKIHKADKDLQRSMDLRGRHEEQQLREPKTQRQPVPNNADFRKRKYSHPPQPLQKQSRSIQQEEEKSIAQLNRQNQFGVTQYQADPAQLITCRQGCGRKFLANRIKKHEAICRDVFQKKRKEFNAQEKRIISKQQRKLMKQNIHKERQQGKQEDIPKWKAMSIALRAHVKMGKDQNYRPNHEEAEMLSQEQHIDVVNCEFCGRNFNKNAAKSHIPFCKGQYQKMIQKERMQRPNRRH